MPVSRAATTEQRLSRNLEVSVLVSPSCVVSTQPERGVADLGAGCPTSATQVLAPAVQRLGPGATRSEHRVLIVNF
jgi:hypothetical protein